MHSKSLVAALLATGIAAFPAAATAKEPAQARAAFSCDVTAGSFTSSESVKSGKSFMVFKFRITCNDPKLSYKGYSTIRRRRDDRGDKTVAYDTFDTKGGDRVYRTVSHCTLGRTYNAYMHMRVFAGSQRDYTVARGRKNVKCKGTGPQPIG